jgi:hypothetical protein
VIAAAGWPVRGSSFAPRCSARSVETRRARNFDVCERAFAAAGGPIRGDI